MPEYPYALTKRMGEELVLHFAKVYKLNATSLRFLTYMGHVQELQEHMGLFLGFLAQKLAKKPLTIVGDGNQKEILLTFQM